MYVVPNGRKKRGGFRISFINFMAQVNSRCYGVFNGRRCVVNASCPLSPVCLCLQGWKHGYSGMRRPSRLHGRNEECVADRNRNAVDVRIRGNTGRGAKTKAMGNGTSDGNWTYISGSIHYSTN